jgi:hypothetical protein
MTRSSNYSLNTGLVRSTLPQKFCSDKEAWNVLAKDLDSKYKTGGQVLTELVKHDVPVTNLHIQHGLASKHALVSRTVAVGYISFDWDGVPWDNPTNCNLCKCPITSKRYRDYGHCDKCQPVINSLFAWNPPFKTMHSKIRKPAKITQKQLKCLEEQSESYWKDAMLLIRDGTLKVIGDKTG